MLAASVLFFHMPKSIKAAHGSLLESVVLQQSLQLNVTSTEKGEVHLAHLQNTVSNVN